MCPAVLPPGIVPQKQKNIEDMKATYQKPQIIAERVETQGLLASSEPAVELTKKTVNASELDSKGNFWDEEDWEE